MMTTTTVHDVVTVPALAMPAGVLRDMLAGALVAASRSSDVPVLATVQLEWAAGEIVTASTDRYRLCVGTYAGESDGVQIVEDATVLIPRDVVASLVKALPKSPARGRGHDMVTVTPVTDRRGEWSVSWSGPTGSGSVTFRQVEGSFPKWRPLIPTGEPDATHGIAWNPAYMADVAKLPHGRQDAVKWVFRGSTRPAVATFPTHNAVDWLYLLMPVRLS